MEDPGQKAVAVEVSTERSHSFERRKDRIKNRNGRLMKTWATDKGPRAEGSEQQAEADKVATDSSHSLGTVVLGNEAGAEVYPIPLFPYTPIPPEDDDGGMVGRMERVSGQVR
eukprot:8758596-Heterocapsa_arctica.AAC.2